MILSLCACNQSAATEPVSKADLVAKAPADASYTISIPSDFVEKENETGLSYVQWVSPDYEETKYEIIAYDVGYSTFVNDVIPSTFEEWSQKEIKDEAGIADEKIFFEYNDGDKYEEYTLVAKRTYTEGSFVYDLKKATHEVSELDFDLDSSEDKAPTEFPDEVVVGVGKKL